MEGLLRITVCGDGLSDGPVLLLKAKPLPNRVFDRYMPLPGRIDDEKMLDTAFDEAQLRQQARTPWRPPEDHSGGGN